MDPANHNTRPRHRRAQTPPDQRITEPRHRRMPRQEGGRPPPPQRLPPAGRRTGSHHRAPRTAGRPDRPKIPGDVARGACRRAASTRYAIRNSRATGTRHPACTQHPARTGHAAGTRHVTGARKATAVDRAGRGPPGSGGRHRRAPEKQASYREVFAIREFRGLWAAQVLSYGGDQFAQVAIAILVYHQTHSPFLTALAYAFTYPPIIGGPFLSGLADFIPRRQV